MSGKPAGGQSAGETDPPAGGDPPAWHEPGAQAASLERGYRWLLRAYPHRYRWERGEEMLTTLLESARPGQRRPTGPEIVDLLAGGLRCRFRLPRGPVYPLVATAVAVIVGLGVSGGAAWLVWSAARTQPSAEHTLAVASTATGLAQPLYPPHSTRSAFPWIVDTGPGRYGSLPGDEPAPGWVSVEFANTQAEPDGAVAQAAQRLTAAGWRVGTVTRTEYASIVWAMKDHEAVQVIAWRLPSNILIELHRTQPGLVTPVAAVGFAAGLATGWQLAGWALRRFQTHGSRSQIGMVLFGIPSLLLAGYPALWAAARMARSALDSSGWNPQDALIPVATVAGYIPLLTVLSVSGLLASLALAAAAPRASAAGAGLWQR